MLLSSTLRLLEVSYRTMVPGDLVDWHAHRHHELCLILEGKPTVGWAGGKLFPAADTLFLFQESEAHGIWNSASVPARLWSFEFRIRSNLKTQFRELLELSPQRRVLKLSADQRKGFCNACQKLALENGALGFLNALAASAWLALQLVNVTRWLLAHSDGDLPDAIEEIDPQCFELRLRPKPPTARRLQPQAKDRFASSESSTRNVKHKK